jgi:H+/Cl- antiporter ClcA
VVELGGNIGLAIGRKLGFRGEDLRGYLASGAASGLAAGFNAPVSAVFFALEVRRRPAPILAVVRIHSRVAHGLPATASACRWCSRRPPTSSY